MMENLDFKNPQWIENTSQIHRWVAIEIHRCLFFRSCQSSIKILHSQRLLETVDEQRYLR